MWCWQEMMVFPKCCLVSVYTARMGSLFVTILGSVAACRFVEEHWCFSHGCFLWKAGTPRPRQHNQCSSWLRGRGGRGGCGLFYLISVSTRASVWCKRVGVFPPPPQFSTLPLSFSLSDVCGSLSLSPSLCAFCFSLHSPSWYTQRLSLWTEKTVYEMLFLLVSI